MTRINALRNILGSEAGTRDSVAWGKHAVNSSLIQSTIFKSAAGSINALAFAAILIACSLAVGCSSEQPKPTSSNNQIPVTPAATPIATAPAPVMQTESKPVVKKVVHKKPATVNYTDKTYGVTFEYPRRYAIETGDAASQLVMSNPVSMNFIQPGGVALAAVELPETGFANTDFSSAFFNVSVHKTLTADQCSEFAVPQPKSTSTAVQATVTSSASATETATPATEAASASSSSARADSAKVTSPDPQPASTQAAPAAANQANVTAVPSAPEAQGSKLLLGDMELRGTEAVSGEGTRQSDSKYFHIFQNGSCYEFALNVTTVASQDGIIKHVDRDKVFGRLEQILGTVKINPVAAPEVTAESPATPAVSATPAQ